MGQQWHYRQGAAAAGPVSGDEIRGMLDRGELTVRDMVRADGEFEWKAIESLPELAEPELVLQEADPLPLDDHDRPRRSRRRRDDDDDDWDESGAGNEAIENIKRVLRCAFSLNLRSLPVSREEDRQLRRAKIEAPTAQRYAVWRRSLLWVLLVPTSAAALFHLVDLLDMEKEQSQALSRFGVAMMYLQVLSLFALPICALIAVLNYPRVRMSSRVILLGAGIAFGLPLLIALIPGEHFIESKVSGDEERLGVGLVFGLKYYVTLLPLILSLLPALSRACIRLKGLLPASIAPGWGFFASAPLFVLIGFASFVLIYHIVSNFLLILGVLLWVGAPLLYLARADLLVKPIRRAKEIRALAAIHVYVLITVAVGVLLIIIFLFTAKLAGKHLVGTDEYKSLLRPWDIGLHARWIEFVGRSLFLTVLFTDLMMRMNISIWKQEKLFYQTPEAAEYDDDLANLQAVVDPPVRSRRSQDDDDDEYDDRR